MKVAKFAMKIVSKKSLIDVFPKIETYRWLRLTLKASPVPGRPRMHVRNNANNHEGKQGNNDREVHRRTK